MNEPTPPEDALESSEKSEGATETQIIRPRITEQETSLDSETEPDDPIDSEKLARTRRAMQETQIIPRSLVKEAERRYRENLKAEPKVTVEEIQAPPPPPVPKWKLPLVGIQHALDSLPYAAMIISQMGAVHPWRTNGRWEWVIEPWARIKDNPGKGPPGEWEKYTDEFLRMKSAGVNTINLETLGGENPNIKLSGLGSVTLLDSRRIRGAQAAGIRIVANLNRT